MEPTYQTTQCNTPERSDLNVQQYAILKSTGWWAAMVQNKAGTVLHLVTLKSSDFIWFFHILDIAQVLFMLQLR